MYFMKNIKSSLLIVLLTTFNTAIATQEDDCIGVLDDLKNEVKNWSNHNDVRVYTLRTFCPDNQNNSCRAFYDPINELSGTDLVYGCMEYLADLVKRDYKKKLTRQEKMREDKAKKLANVIALEYKNSGISESDKIVWGTGTIAKGKPGKSNYIKLLNLVNVDVYNKVSTKKKTFVPPVKGEFERTTDFDKRVNATRKRHDKEEKEKANNLQANRNSITSAAVNDALKSPFLSTYKYNADKEVFNIFVSSTEADINIKMEYPVPIDKARNEKSKIQKMIPWVLFTIDEGLLKLHKVMLQSDAAIIALTPSADSFKEVAFGDKAAIAKLKEMEEKNKKEAAARQKRMKETTASTKKSQTVSSANQLDYGQRYAMEINRSMLSSGACGVFQQNISMLGNTSAPANIRVKQIDTLVDKADRAGCFMY